MFYVIHMSGWAGHNQPKSSNIVSNGVRMHHIASLLSTVTITLQLYMVRKQQIASLFQNLQSRHIKTSTVLLCNFKIQISVIDFVLKLFKLLPSTSRRHAPNPRAAFDYYWHFSFKNVNMTALPSFTSIHTYLLLWGSSRMTVSILANCKSFARVAQYDSVLRCNTAAVSFFHHTFF